MHIMAEEVQYINLKNLSSYFTGTTVTDVCPTLCRLSNSQFASLTQCILIQSVQSTTYPADHFCFIVLF